MAKKPKTTIGWPYKYPCNKGCGDKFTWDKDRIAHEKKCKA